MSRDFYEDFEDGCCEVDEIMFLYELRHSCNVLGADTVAEGLEMQIGQVYSLYHSNLHGSTCLIEFFSCPKENFKKLLKKYKREEIDKQQRIEDAHEKNALLIEDLKIKRKLFAGIGTNKAKRRLNKLAKTNSIAKAVRLALEIEDKSISAKNSYGQYKDKIYDQKTKLILDLCDLFKQEKWIYGVQESEVPPASHVIYFEIPSCEQISWHFSTEEKKVFPKYAGKWDKKENSTIDKLEKVAIELLKDSEK